MNKKAFTLVELIVVVTILAILGTIGFVSYSSYISGVRDANRTASLESISTGLALYSTRGSLPLPDNSVNISSDGTNVVLIQGDAGTTVLETIDYSKGGLDPADNTPFIYTVTSDRKTHQLMAFLEESGNLQAHNLLFSQSYAADLSIRYPITYGKKLGIILDATSTPAHNAGADINLATLDATYTAYLSNEDKITDGFIEVNPNASCRRIFETSRSRKDGVYTINPAGNAEFDVYCDMTTLGGGWTYATMIADATTLNLFDTGNTNKITSLTKDISSKGQISDIWRDESSKDIMFVCNINGIVTGVDPDPYATAKKYETPFIIFDFLKSDIANLEKPNKEGTVFSSSPLQASWNSNKYTLQANYGNNSGNTTEFIIDESAGRAIIELRSTSTSSTLGGFTPSPALASGTAFATLSQDNYCMTAIR